MEEFDRIEVTHGETRRLRSVVELSRCRLKFRSMVVWSVRCCDPGLQRFLVDVSGGSFDPAIMKPCEAILPVLIIGC